MDGHRASGQPVAHRIPLTGHLTIATTPETISGPVEFRRPYTDAACQRRPASSVSSRSVGKVEGDQRNCSVDRERRSNIELEPLRVGDDHFWFPISLMLNTPTRIRYERPLIVDPHVSQ